MVTRGRFCGQKTRPDPPKNHNARDKMISASHSLKNAKMWGVGFQFHPLESGAVRLFEKYLVRDPCGFEKLDDAPITACEFQNTLNGRPAQAPPLAANAHV